MAGAELAGAEPGRVAVDVVDADRPARGPGEDGAGGVLHAWAD